MKRVIFHELRLFETLVPPAQSRAHTLPSRPSTCSACRATAQASSLGSRQLMDGLGGHVARAFRRCSWSPTGHFSGGAHTQLFRKAGDPPLSRRVGQLAPAAYRSDHILADSDRWVTPDLSRRQKATFALLFARRRAENTTQNSKTRVYSFRHAASEQC